MYRSYISQVKREADAKRLAENGAELWDTLDKDPRHGQRQAEHAEQTRPPATRTVRVFVSSTFRDFFSERDILIKKVFPAIRDWLSGYNMNLVECDLRWGVPIESTTQQTITACLEELDKYRKETGDQPFFLGLLGDRAGWIPTRADVGDELWERYDWIPGVSITGMEILRGAYWNNNENACFLIRDRSFLDAVPSEFHADFIEQPNCFADTVIQETKRRVREKFGQRVVTYQCTFRELDEQNTLGVRKVILDGLEKFCEDATHFLKTFIKRCYRLPDEPPRRVEANETSETDVQQAYLETLLSSPIYGREREVTRIVDWLVDSNVSDLHALPSNSEQPAALNKQLLCVHGEPGVGRTYLVTKLLHVLRSKPDVRVVYHFCDAGSESGNPDQLTVNLLRQASEVVGVQPSADGRSSEQFAKALQLLAACEQQVLLVVDGLDHSFRVDSWLPKEPFPPNVYLLATTSSADRHGNAVLSDAGALELQLQPLALDICRAWITSFFADYNKRLDAMQMDTLLGNGGVRNPTWLRLVLEELHVYGEYSTVLKRIQSLPPDITKLSGEILTRVLHDDDTGKLHSLLCLLAVAREGLYESQLSALLGDFRVQPSTVLPPVTVAQLRREIRGFTRSTGGGQLRMASSFLKTLVRKRMVPDFEHGAQWHTHLADFFDLCESDSYKVSRELPHHLMKANLRQRIVTFFTSDRRCVANHVERKGFMADLLCPMVTMVQKEPAVLCVFCANGIGKLAPFQPSGDVCFVCGIHAFQAKQAAFCHIHGFHYAMGNMKKCAVCKNVVMPQQATPMKVCDFCKHSVIPPDRCCQFLLNEREQMYSQLFNQTCHKWLDDYKDNE